MESNIKVNDFVWAKLAGYPPWPSVVVEPGFNVPDKPNSEMHWIYFFGSHNYAWVEESHLKPYSSYKEKFTALYKTMQFKEAVAEIEDILEELNKNPDYVWPIQSFKNKERTISKRVRESGASSTKKKFKHAVNHVTSSEASASQYNLTYDTTNKNETTTSEFTFGVLGVGIMGSRIVKNLTEAGHKVNIWNRTRERCTELETRLQMHSPGVRRPDTFLTPRALMQNSDIVLNCVSDCDVSKKILQNYFGINNSADKVLKGKGFVEITSIDPETSKDIRDMIEMKGGRYLEAQIQGSKREADEGKLVILTAGNRSLFLDCQPCFEAIAKSAYFLGDIGYAAKINLILQVIKGVCLVGLAEGFALAERCKIKVKDLVNIFESSDLACNYIIGKANIIYNKNFNDVEQSLQSMQKDMYLGLELSNKMGQPMQLASMANEILKHCRRFDLGEKDASSVYLRTMF